MFDDTCKDWISCNQNSADDLLIFCNGMDGGLALCYSSADSIVNKEMQMSNDGASVDVHYCSTIADFFFFDYSLQSSHESH